MSPGRRVPAVTAARRVNAAAALLAEGRTVPEAARALARRQRVSPRQARRYLERAQATGGVALPTTTTVFTVKLGVALARRVRTQARHSGRTISAVVTQALEECLDRLK